MKRKKIFTISAATALSLISLGASPVKASTLIDFEYLFQPLNEEIRIRAL